ncbi:MAG: zf-HC2 domain-containing protein [Sedimentisphaerales bacterium]|nr:zf-HC2 domain-containing protein [Sedimentisphaerales bacterium]
MEKCPKIPIEKIIEYCDGELSQNETEQVAQHISDCQICKANVQVLQNSLSLAQNIWEGEKGKWGDLQSFNKRKLYKFPIRKLISIAAGIVIIFSVALLWLHSKSNETTNLKMPKLTATEIEIQAEQVAFAAQLLAVGDMYAAQPGAEQYAAQRYNDIIESFPSSPQSEQAKLHLQNLLERKIQ